MALCDMQEIRTKNWREIAKESITGIDGLQDRFQTDFSHLAPVIEKHPMRINPYYLSLIRKPDDPLGRQAIPDPRELDTGFDSDDPLSEESLSPVRSLIHRYPDRVVFIVSNSCAMFCRYCMRKRNIPDHASPFQNRREELEKGIRYIHDTPRIKDVILSGGDPLMLETSELVWLLGEIRAIRHVEIIRIHTRIPCTLPTRVTDHLVSVLKTYHPLYINTHFNHPDEMTGLAGQALSRLADAGIPLGCQTVLLKGVNDTPQVMIDLMRKLVKNRVKPYYIHHPDPVAGTFHFRPPLESGLAVMKALRGHVSGLCVPHYMIDLPGGKGKMALLPQNIISVSDDKLLIENHLGERCEYAF